MLNGDDNAYLEGLSGTLHEVIGVNYLDRVECMAGTQK